MYLWERPFVSTCPFGEIAESRRAYAKMTSEFHCRNQWWVPEGPTKKDPPSEPAGSRSYQRVGTQEQR